MKIKLWPHTHTFDFYFFSTKLFARAQGLKPSDFTTKDVQASKNRKGKREYLNDQKTNEMMRELNDYFDTKIEIPLIRYESDKELKL